jgi:outer membrane protein insertion porin family
LWATLSQRPAHAQTAAPTPGNSTGVVDVSRDLPAALVYKGRRVEQVQVLGNTQVSTSVILNLVRTREGDPFDPATVVEDYQRIYRLNKFSNVEPRLEPTAGGVIITFVVSEQKQIRAVRFKGNVNVPTPELITAAGLRAGESIDPFRINLGKTQIEKVYHDKNYSFAHVVIDEAELARTGEVLFQIVEGPFIRVRKVGFIGNTTFSNWRLKDQIKTAYYIPIFRSGQFDPETVDEDVAAIKRYYQDKGFFDARVGRKITFGGNWEDLQVTFIIDEGPRYQIDHVLFKGNVALPEATLRKGLNMTEGTYYDHEILDRDVRQLVRDYSPFGFIYQQPTAIESTQSHPEYLHIDGKPIFKNVAGHIDLVYDISEGSKFAVGRIFVKGNGKTQDKVVLRELHFSSGQLYNSAEVTDAIDRLRGTPYFTQVSITPIGDDPHVRDVIVEVAEARTASITVGAGINSNLGLSGNLSYEQRNFDLSNPPNSFGDITSERAFTGAGQDFRASFNPGTVATTADIYFFEPYLFDTPFSFSNDLYLSDIIREHYTDRRVGDEISISKQFDYVYSAGITLKGENVGIRDIQGKFVTDSSGNLVLDSSGNPIPDRPLEILNADGHHMLTDISLSFARDTTNRGPILYKGNRAIVTYSEVGAMGGQVNYRRVSFQSDDYQEINEDLLDRRTVLHSHLWVGDDLDGAPFYERFYGGGIGSIRGFGYRGVSPRAGLENDPVGGNFGITGGLELEFPLVEDILRGDVFTDEGDIERNVRFGTIRASAGVGFRLILPFLGNQPLRVDFGVPFITGSHDHPQVISFAFGVSR